MNQFTSHTTNEKPENDEKEIVVDSEVKEELTYLEGYRELLRDNHRSSEHIGYGNY